MHTISDRCSKVSELEKLFDSGEPWAVKALDFIGSQTDELQFSWSNLLRHCSGDKGSAPKTKWLKEVEPLFSAVGDESFLSFLNECLPLLKEKRTDEEPDGDFNRSFDDYSIVYAHNNAGSDVLQGLIWLCDTFNDADTATLMRTVAADMFSKIPLVGPRNAKVANAAAMCLAKMQGSHGLRQLLDLRAQTKYKRATSNIDRCIDKAAELRKTTTEQLVSVIASDYELSGVGYKQGELGEYSYLLALIGNGRSSLTWSCTKTGKVQKSVPQAVKTGHVEALKQLRQLDKSIKLASSSHVKRIEGLYRLQSDLPFADWQDQYLEHRLIGFIARRLIWRFSYENCVVDAIWQDDQFVDCSGKVVEPAPKSLVSLWHPLNASTEQVLKWRTFIVKAEITQPFKQAFRETYSLTDAERKSQVYSERFSGHVLNHLQFHALTDQRGWHQTLGGQWDCGSQNEAVIGIPAFETSVRFDARGNDDYGLVAHGYYSTVLTGRLTVDVDGKGGDLENVESLIYSEIMRDVDLFVSVSNIANDPEWRERHRDWYKLTAGELSETAKTRKQVLSALIPKLKIAKQLKIDGKFLEVEGKRQTYRIHCGSGSVFIKPNSRYLCIVESRKKANVMLPFEGDEMLSLILSKAMLLAADDKIKDTEILSQMGLEVSNVE
ncbi:DUF4132 domain-containing protein [Corallincola luteus]|uniref:DUF4132 domain-containing protein n=1 Tax=Corallincola luteus TaxID=1775177 RepID=A0ABY2AIQ5_9GAMM|nr:DUF4132 domain-containing protein [Corallincola luteus]TCI02011.1 DUF4132 domain-containing protein [Corallincola luteus]